MLKHEPFRLCFCSLFPLPPSSTLVVIKKKINIKRQTNIHILRRTYSKEIKSKYEHFELLFNVVYFDATRDSVVEEVRESSLLDKQPNPKPIFFFRERAYGKRMFHTNENIYFNFNQKPTHSMFITFFFFFLSFAALFIELLIFKHNDFSFMK